MREKLTLLLVLLVGLTLGQLLAQSAAASGSCGWSSSQIERVLDLLRDIRDNTKR